ncbi:MAG: hypothetical protein PF541_05935 [Prolixibacteraceae bacterium]|jgi:hypothetical protein|nr:hypothetical protein [Prolixibacteraceae bacterium]
MKTTKLFLTTVFLFVVSIGFTQPPGGGGQSGGEQGPPPVPNTKQIQKMVTQLANEIALTEEQETSVLKLYTAHFKTIKQKTSGNARPNREEMDALKSEFEKNVKALLTRDQQIKFDAYQKKNGSGSQEQRPIR